MICAYVYYVYLTAKSDTEGSGHLEDLLLARILRAKIRMNIIVVQLVIALGGIAVGAHFFVEALKESAYLLHIDPKILALILAPVATELPEKFNSIIWIGKGKDTLAIGNITGAMVFQSCIPVSIGILFTPWQFDTALLLSAIAAILAGAVNYIMLKINNEMSPHILMISGLFYLGVITYIFAFR